MARGRPKKEQPEDLTQDVIEPPAPIEVKLVRERVQNPDAGKFPYDDEVPEMGRYKMIHNQQPGTNVSFTRGRTVLSRSTGRRKTVHEKYDIPDESTVDLPKETAEFLMGLTYYEDGRSRTRFSLIPQ